MHALTHGEILKLALSERIQLVQDIWDSIAECPDAMPLTEAQSAELDRRLAAYRQNPDAGSPWALVRERVRTSR